MATIPPPPPDPAHLETRLLVVAEMLEQAVAEVHRAMADIRGNVKPQPDEATEAHSQVRRTDV